MSIRICITLFLFLTGNLLHAETIAPQVAGAFYPADKEQLKSMVDDFLAQAPTQTLKGDLLGGLSPHAGYIYSGSTAARFYRLLRGRSYDTAIILASGHRMGIKGAATIQSGTFATPLGSVAINADMIQTLMKLTPLIEHKPEAFQGEHAVEVQLPFLQTVLNNAKLVPLLMNTDDPRVAQEIGAALAKIMKPGKVLLIVSSDLAHYPHKNVARVVDLATLEAMRLAHDDPEYFWLANRMLMERGPKNMVCTYCGEAAALTALHAVKPFKGQSRVLGYINSGELAHGEPDRAVGYAAVAWTKSAPAPQRPQLTKTQKDALLKLSREALVNYIAKKENPKRAIWNDLEFNLPAAVFMTLRRKDRPHAASLRGCIGSLVCDLPLAEAVQAYAVRSAVEDPRFRPVTAEELNLITIEVSMLTPFRKVSSAQAVKPGQGVLIRQGRNSGLFLPSVWEDIPDKTDFLNELCSQKAHLPDDCWNDPKTEIQVFDAEKFGEKN
ncbi:MAG: AmmeMemoRadiSam system protein B [Elusimicrobia bacterium]|nr:AmmeMemoRadiSam system protein B [Elusimicrobiota bacterium]